MAVKPEACGPELFGPVRERRFERGEVPADNDRVQASMASQSSRRQLAGKGRSTDVAQTVLVEKRMLRKRSIIFSRLRWSSCAFSFRLSVPTSDRGSPSRSEQR
jgi:hypothetical protein